jgi:radical SAM family uncharacterized protein
MEINKIQDAQIASELEQILPRVAKPGRYTGGELNSIIKLWDRVQVRLALAFPDIYDLGMSNLGLMILYDLVNRRPEMLAERVFAPWTDMEDEMRAAGLPLHSLESKRPIASFDVVGFSLPYEQLYSNTLNMLDLAGIPLLSSERDHRHPLIIAGGHATFNPEPMAIFMDVFAIGDGEEVLVDLMEMVARAKQSGIGREELLQQLATIPGVYVPALYNVSYLSDGTIASVRPKVPGIPERVRKRIVATLPAAMTSPIVPFIQTTHNRAVIEIARGCTRGCRFCHAGIVTRPVRERPVAEVLDSLEDLLANTGYEEVALLSLSSSDYSGITELVTAISEKYGDRRLGISLPSLRIETSSADLMEAISYSRRGGFTFAPEAATDRMRGIINKMMPEKQILEVAEQVFSRGWRTIKLYFMIGHPQESLNDVKAVADLAWQILRIGRKHHGRQTQVNIGVSTFIPKPHTPFQWTAVDQVEQIEAKLEILKEMTRGRGLDLKWNNVEETLFEALLSRGDRRLGSVIQRSWELGAKFDGWQEHFDLALWKQALTEQSLTLDFYTHRQRTLDELLAWEHIETGVHKRHLIREYERSMQGETLPDCREQCVACGILTAFRAERMETASDDWACPSGSSNVNLRGGDKSNSLTADRGIFRTR